MKEGGRSKEGRGESTCKTEKMEESRNEMKEKEKKKKERSLVQLCSCLT